MSFTFLHSSKNKPPIAVPQIGLTLHVRVPPANCQLLPGKNKRALSLPGVWNCV
jgi:hypothetical protein